MVQFAKHSPHCWSWGWWEERKWPPLPQGYSQSRLPVEMTSPRPHPACPQRRAQVRFCTGPLTLRSQQEGDMPYPHTGEPRSCSTWSPGGGFRMGVPVPHADAEVSGPTPCSPPDPDACLRSAQHHLPGSWVLPASCPSLTQTTPPQSGHLSLSKLGSNPVTLHIQLPSATPHPARTEPSPTRLSPPALTSCRPPRFGPGRSQCRC